MADEDESLTLWDIVCRNVAPVDRQAKRLKKLREKEAAKKQEEEQLRLREDLGNDLDLLNLFQAGPTAKPEVPPAEVLDCDLFSGSFHQESPRALPETYELFHEEADNTKLPPFAGAYRRRKFRKWSLEMTDRFYEAVEIFGSDFFLLGAHFPELGDREIKRKWDSEMRSNPARLAAALAKRKKLTTGAAKQLMPEQQNETAQKQKSEAKDDDWFSTFVADQEKTEVEDDHKEEPLDLIFK